MHRQTATVMTRFDSLFLLFLLFFVSFFGRDRRFHMLQVVDFVIPTLYRVKNRKTREKNISQLLSHNYITQKQFIEQSIMR